MGESRRGDEVMDGAGYAQLVGGGEAIEEGISKLAERFLSIQARTLHHHCSNIACRIHDDDVKLK